MSCDPGSFPGHFMLGVALGKGHTKASVDRCKETLRRYFDDPKNRAAIDERTRLQKATKAETKRVKSIAWANTLADGQTVDYRTWSKAYDQSLIPAQRARADLKMKQRRQDPEVKRLRRERRKGYDHRSRESAESSELVERTDTHVR